VGKQDERIGDRMIDEGGLMEKEKKQDDKGGKGVCMR